MLSWARGCLRAVVWRWAGGTYRLVVGAESKQLSIQEGREEGKAMNCGDKKPPPPGERAQHLDVGKTDLGFYVVVPDSV